MVNATKERQAWCCLQVKLCDPCLSALYVPWCEKALYKYSFFPFPFLFGPGHTALYGNQLPNGKGHSSPTFGPCLLWPSGRPSQLLLSSCFDFPLTVLILTSKHDIYIAPYTGYNSSLRRSGTARVNEGPATHTCMHVIPIPAFTPKLQSTAAFWQALAFVPRRVGG